MRAPRVVLVGAHHWHAGLHLRAFRAAGARVVAVTAADPAVARDLAAREGLTAHDTPEAALEAERPDLAVVMGTPLEMPAALRAAVEAGVPALVEKPVAPTAGALEPLAALAEARGAFVAVALPNRLSPVFAARDRLEREGRLGALAHAHFRVVNGPARRYERDGVPWMLEPRVSGGGALRNLGIHGVDAFRFAAREAVTLEHAALRADPARPDLETHALLVLRAASGALGVVEAGYSFASLEPGGDFEWRLAAANAYLVERDDALLEATLDDGRRSRAPATPQGSRYDDLARDTLARLRDGRAPLATLGDLLEAMRLVDAAYRAWGRAC